MKDKKLFNISLILTIVASYIFIRIIDSYQYFLGIFKVLLSLLTPFVIAFILAYILNPLVSLLENKLNIKRIFALLITYGAILLMLISFIFFTAPIIISSLADIVSQLPIYAQKTQDFIVELGNSLKNVDPATLKDVGDKIMTAIPDLSNLLIGYLGQFFSTTFSISKFIVQFVLAFIICFYIILEKEGFFDFCKKVLYVVLGKRVANLIIDVGNTLNINIGKYFSGKILDSTIVGILSGVGLYFIGSQYAFLFGCLIGVMNLIPYFGPVIGMAPVVIINLFYSPNVALFSLAYLLLVQQIEVAIIEPKIVGGQLGLSPFLTILAVTVGGGFFGIPGMILSVPIMGVIKIYLCEFIEYKHNKLDGI